MYTYKEETKTIKKENLMNFKLDNHLNNNANILDGARASIVSGKPNKEGDFVLTVLYEKEVKDDS